MARIAETSRRRDAQPPVDPSPIRRAAPAPHPGPGLSRLLPRTVKGRQRLRTVGILLAAVALGYVVTWIAYPSPLVSPDVAVGRLLGLPLEAARQELESQGFRVRLENPVSDPVIPAGHVVWQDPPPGTLLPKGGAVVSVIPSNGPASVPVPDVTGFDLDLARQVIGAAGLRVGAVDSVVSPTEPGVVVASRPGSGSFRPPATAVELVVSRGTADIRVPSLLGADQEEARQRLENAGLRLGSISTRPARRGAVGVVVDQRPGPGMLSPRGARVNLVISQ